MPFVLTDLYPLKHPYLTVQDPLVVNKGKKSNFWGK